MADLRWAVRASAVAVLLFCGGCSTLRDSFDWLRFGKAGSPPPPIDLLAVLPLREMPPSLRDGKDERPVLESHAGRAVTAQVYRYLADQTRFRFVPDLEVAELAPPTRGDQVEAARELARASEADAVIFGSVYRFQERIGTKYAASHPASVSFDLALYVAANDEVVWKGSFDETQESLSSNLFNWWMFWKAGPYWFTARELAGLGVDKLLDDMNDVVPD